LVGILLLALANPFRDDGLSFLEKYEHAYFSYGKSALGTNFHNIVNNYFVHVVNAISLAPVLILKTQRKNCTLCV
jgi:hypothetical protein